MRVAHLLQRRQILASASGISLLSSFGPLRLLAGDGSQLASAPSYHAALPYRWQAGLSISPVNGPCEGVFATLPLPQAWPEQSLELVDREASRQVTAVRHRQLDSAVPQALITIPRIDAGDTARVLMTYEVEVQAVRAPSDPARLSVPTSMPAAVRRQLATSPGINPRATAIRTRASELVASAGNDWDRVAALYDWVRDHVNCRDCERQGSLLALQKGWGNKEDVSSLFIALCRALRIPARTVWVPDHNYAEFYLQTSAGKGHWFPCEMIAGRSFGELSSRRPILQRGDNFRVPENKQTLRYVPEHLKVSRALAQPQVKFIRELTNVS
jgi:hypothetical protein